MSFEFIGKRSCENCKFLVKERERDAKPSVSFLVSLPPMPPVHRCVCKKFQVRLSSTDAENDGNVNTENFICNHHELNVLDRHLKVINKVNEGITKYEDGLRRSDSSS